MVIAIDGPAGSGKSTIAKMIARRMGFTYINSGNVLFSTDIDDRAQLAARLRAAVEQRAGVDVGIQLRSEQELGDIIGAIPASWANNDSMKCDVVFLEAEVDRADILAELGPRPGIEDALYVPGAVVWRVDRANATRNRLTRIVGTPHYSRVTIRNCNTVRKLLELVRT